MNNMNLILTTTILCLKTISAEHQGQVEFKLNKAALDKLVDGANKAWEVAKHLAGSAGGESPLSCIEKMIKTVQSRENRQSDIDAAYSFRDEINQAGQLVLKQFNAISSENDKNCAILRSGHNDLFILEKILLTGDGVTGTEQERADINRIINEMKGVQREIYRSSHFSKFIVTGSYFHLDRTFKFKNKIWTSASFAEQYFEDTAYVSEIDKLIGSIKQLQEINRQAFSPIQPQEEGFNEKAMERANNMPNVGTDQAGEKSQRAGAQERGLRSGWKRWLRHCSNRRN